MQMPALPLVHLQWIDYAIMGVYFAFVLASGGCCEDLREQALTFSYRAARYLHG